VCLTFLPFLLPATSIIFPFFLPLFFFRYSFLCGIGDFHYFPLICETLLLSSCSSFVVFTLSFRYFGTVVSSSVSPSTSSFLFFLLGCLDYLILFSLHIFCIFPFLSLFCIASEKRTQLAYFFLFCSLLSTARVSSLISASPSLLFLVCASLPCSRIPVCLFPPHILLQTLECFRCPSSFSLYFCFA